MVRTTLSYIGLVCLYTLAFKVYAPVAAVMLAAHTAYEYLAYREAKVLAEAMKQFMIQVDNQQEPPSNCGNC